MGAQWKVINENYKNLEGYKRVAWPPASEERIVREFTPQPQTQSQPMPAYNQQQQQNNPSAAAGASAMPSTQDPIYNNVQHNMSSFVWESKSPYEQNPNQNHHETYPLQAPETPIILKDKQFSRLPSQEPNQTNNVSTYQQHQLPQNQQLLYNQQSYQQQQQKQLQYLANLQQQKQYQNQEEHHQHELSGWKAIRPPQTRQDHLFTGHCGARETAPTAPPSNLLPATNEQQQYRAPSFDNYQQLQQQQYQQTPQQQYPLQKQYQAKAPQAFQNLYHQSPQAGSYQQPTQQPAWAQQQPVQQQPQQYQQPTWVQQQPQEPRLYQPQQQQSQYQNSLNQYNQTPHQQQQYPKQKNQFVPQTNQQQFNSYSQPQQQQQTMSYDQVDQQHHRQAHLSQDQRGASPGIITLRKEAPVTQKPAPVYTSQPAAISFRGGCNMRGDLKWPPPEYKEAAAKENEERRKLAMGPVCRPRKVNRDYTSFFAKNALSHHYPSYKVPPGTQHMIN